VTASCTFLLTVLSCTMGIIQGHGGGGGAGILVKHTSMHLLVGTGCRTVWLCQMPFAQAMLVYRVCRWCAGSKHVAVYMWVSVALLHVQGLGDQTLATADAGCCE
jgi:hypothetical protein